MPGVFQQPLEAIEADVEDALALGIATVLLFGVPDEKDTEASSAWDESGVIQQATKRLKDRFGDDITVITDTCLCEYMTHGHCGIAIGGSILNDPSVELLGRVALSQAAAGADMVGMGRMQCLGLAAGGQAGVVRMLEILEHEIVTCMGLLGVNNWGELDRSYIASAPAIDTPHTLSAFPLLSLDEKSFY